MKQCHKLKGHQIIGELRHDSEQTLANVGLLKGHQIIGELRRYHVRVINVFNN